MFIRIIDELPGIAGRIVPGTLCPRKCDRPAPPNAEGVVLESGTGNGDISARSEDLAADKSTSILGDQLLLSFDRRLLGSEPLGAPGRAK